MMLRYTSALEHSDTFYRYVYNEKAINSEVQIEVNIPSVGMGLNVYTAFCGLKNDSQSTSGICLYSVAQTLTGKSCLLRQSEWGRKKVYIH